MLSNDIIVIEKQYKNISFTAGTIGTRGAQYANEIDTVFDTEKYELIGLFVSGVSDSNAIKPMIFTSTSSQNNKVNLYLNIYRGTASATSNQWVNATIVLHNKHS